MTIDEARHTATSTLIEAQMLNASHEHAESLKRGKLASIILDLCYQLERGDHVSPTPPPPVDDLDLARAKAKAKK